MQGKLCMPKFLLMIQSLLQNTVYTQYQLTLILYYTIKRLVLTNEFRKKEGAVELDLGKQ